MASNKAVEAGEVSIADPPHLEHQHDRDEVARLKAVDRVIHSAKMASEKEQKMTLLQGIKLYPKAILWSILISTCIVMEGYDICLVNNFYAFPQFNEKYGEQLPSGEWQVPAPWQAGLSNVSIDATRRRLG